MKDLSMHILDIAANSIKAGAKQVEVELRYAGNRLEMIISDNGCGMDAEMVARITDPYATSRTSRKVGLGLPFLKMNAEQTGGNIMISSAPGRGTTVKALFVTDHIDCVPPGDLASSLSLLMTGNPEVNFVIRMIKEDEEFEVSSAEINEVLDGIPISHPKVGVFVRIMLKEEF
jgi:signal transduction histidine kinase